MNSDTPLDYALFQLSPRRSRCELLVFGDGKMEKLALGLVKPFAAHLKVVEEQAAQPVQSIRLEVEHGKNTASWFNKGTLERFVRFVSTPEILESVNIFDAEMSQLEGARRIYLQVNPSGIGDQLSGSLGENKTITADVTKKELLRAIDQRLAAVKEDLIMACMQASATGFTLDSVSELLLFADCFGAHRLNEACTKFISLCQWRPEVIRHQHQPMQQPTPHWRGSGDENIHSSSSDMSIDEPELESTVSGMQSISISNGPQHFNPRSSQPPALSQGSASELPANSQRSETILHPSMEKGVEEKVNEEPATSASQAEMDQPTGEGGLRRLSLKDRIKFFESKQKEQLAGANSITGGSGINSVTGGKPELRRLSSDISMEKSLLRRWNRASDMSTNLNISDNRKGSWSSGVTPTYCASYQAYTGSKSEEKGNGHLKDSGTSQSGPVSKGNTRTPCFSSSSFAEVRDLPVGKDRTEVGASMQHIATTFMQPKSGLEEEGDLRSQISASLGTEQLGGFCNRVAPQAQAKASVDSSEGAKLKEQAASSTQFKAGSQEHDGLKSQTAYQFPSKAVSAVGEQSRQKCQKDYGSLLRSFPAGEDNIGMKDQSTSMIPQFRSFPSGKDNIEMKDQPTSMIPRFRSLPAGEDNIWMKDRPTSMIPQFMTFRSKTEDFEEKCKGPSDHKQSEVFSGSFEVVTQKAEFLAPQSKWRNVPEKLVAVEKKNESSSSVKEKEEKEHSGLRGRKLHRQISVPGRNKDLQGRKVDVTPSGNATPVSIGRKGKELKEMCDSSSTSSIEQVELVRPLKGNQQLNDELQMKADELERLFSAHMHRISGDQMGISSRSKQIESQVDHVSMSVEKKLTELPDSLSETKAARKSLSNGVEFDATLLLKMVDNQEFVYDGKQKLGSAAKDYRGKFYEKYTQKRDAKLREEWGSKRAQKYEKMKAMHASLEHSLSEMKAKFSGSADKQSLRSARHRLEMMRSFNTRTAKCKSQMNISSSTCSHSGSR